MGNYTNKELVYAAFKGEKIQTIPKFMVGPGYIAAHSGMNPMEYMKDADKYVKANLDFQKKYGTSVNLAGAFKDITAQMGTGLINKDGKESTTGEETVQTVEDIEKLHPYSFEKSFMLKDAVNKIAVFKKQDPETPTMAVVANTPMIASDLMGAAVYYKALLRKKEFVKELSEAVEPIAFQGLERLAEAGCDIIWIPMPTMGGTCISKKMYLESCHESSKRYVKKVHELGMKAIIHTCGNWNDRFDIVLQEQPDALHLSEAILPEFSETYGKEICMIGNISVVDTLMNKNADEVYKDCYQACLDAGNNGNYIIAPDCGTPPTIAEENIIAMYKAADDASLELFGERG